MAKLRIQPLQISLNEIPNQGKTYQYTRESAELDKAFSDLILPQQNYSVEITIKPMGNVFEMRGSLKTQMQIPCALCGIDLPHQVDENLQEILVIEENLPRAGHEAKVNHVHELHEGPSAQMLETEIFDVAEYLHEMLALTVPIRKTRGTECESGFCLELEEYVKNGLLTLDTKSKGTATHNPFGVLQGLKLKS